MSIGPLPKYYSNRQEAGANRVPAPACYTNAARRRIYSPRLAPFSSPFTPLVHLAPIEAAALVARHVIRMNVAAANACPRPVIEEKGVLAPAKADAAAVPSPGGEGGSQGNARAEANPQPNAESRPRREEHHGGVVIRHIIETRVHRNDVDIRPVIDHELRRAAQIAVVPRTMAQTLHRVHHAGAVAQESVAQGP